MDVDTAAPHYHPVAAVDSLVAVAGDEKVITSRGSDGPNQRKGLSAHVLGFIHDDGGIAAAGTVFSEQCGGIPVGIVHFLQAALSELCAVLLEYRPYPDTSAAAKTRAAPDAGHATVFLLAHHSFRLDDLFPLVFVEGVGQVQLRRLQVERPLPSLPVASEFDVELVPLPAQKAHHPPIQVRHLLMAT